MRLVQTDAVNVTISKLLLDYVGETTMAALLYLGAGIGISILSMLMRKDRTSSENLSGKDLPYVIGMIVLDIAAPIFLMAGSAVVVIDTLILHHTHEHQHTFTHTHDGSTHEHTITHVHDHAHYVMDSKHGHHHTMAELEHEPGAAHAG